MPWLAGYILALIAKEFELLYLEEFRSHIVFWCGDSFDNEVGMSSFEYNSQCFHCST